MSKQQAIKLQQDLFLPFFIQRVFSAICKGLHQEDGEIDAEYKERRTGYLSNLEAINEMCDDISKRGKHQETAIRRIKRTIDDVINLLEPPVPDIKKMNTQHYMQLICFLFEDLQEEFGLLEVHENLYKCMDCFFESYEKVGFNQKQQKATVKREEKVFKLLNEKGLFLRKYKEVA